MTAIGDERMRPEFGTVRRPRAPVFLLAAASFVAVTGAVERARGAEPVDVLYVELAYEVRGAPGRCWDEPAFRRAVAQSLGYEPFRDGAALSVEVHVGASEALVDGSVKWRKADGASMGERRFRAKDGDCAALLTEMSFAVGLQIDLLRPRPESGGAPSAAQGPGSTTTSPASSSASSRPGSQPAQATPSGPQPSAGTPERATAERSASESSSSATERDHASSGSSPSAADWRFWAGAGPSLAFGAAPSVTGHGRLFAGVRRGALSLELGAEATLEVSERVPDGSGFTQRWIGGSATACGHAGVLIGCVIGKAGQLRVAGFAVDEPHSPTAPVVHAGVRLGAPWDLSPVWFLTPHVDALALLTPRAVELNDVTLWDMPPLSVLAGIDVGGRFR